MAAHVAARGTTPDTVYNLDTEACQLLKKLEEIWRR